MSERAGGGSKHDEWERSRTTTQKIMAQWGEDPVARAVFCRFTPAGVGKLLESMHTTANANSKRRGATARARGRRSKPGARAQGAPAPGPALMGIATPDSGWFSLSEECHLHRWVSCRHWMDKAQFGFRRGNAPSRKRWVCATSSLQKPEKKVPLASE